MAEGGCGVPKREESDDVINEDDNNASAKTPLILSPSQSPEKNTKKIEKEEKITNKELEEVHKHFNAIFDDKISCEQRKTDFETLLNGEAIAKMKRIYSRENYEMRNIKNHLPVQKSLVSRFSLQGVLAKMLNDIDKYAEILKLFIKCFAAFNECLDSGYLPRDDAKKDKAKKQRRPIISDDPRPIQGLDAPLHCAVRQLNEDFIKWLLEQHETEVNLRNKRRETPLAILCKMYDWCKQHIPKLKIQLKDIEKELKTANEKKLNELEKQYMPNRNIQLKDTEKEREAEIETELNELKEEKNKVSALETELNKNEETILERIKQLLKKGAEFNIYMNHGSLPFDLLFKYKKEESMANLINSYVKSNVAMTELMEHSGSKVKQKSEGKNESEGKNKSKGKKESKKRIETLYNESHDKDVTVGIFQFCIDFNGLEKSTDKDESTGKAASEDNDKSEGKKKSTKRIVTFYKEKKEDVEENKKDEKVVVTVELLEIFMCFNDIETFEKYWKDFIVTSENVKQVIKLLLHGAVERNSKIYVDLIIQKASEEIFKLKGKETLNTKATFELTSEKQAKSTVASSSMNAEGSSKKNSSVTEGAGPQSGQSKFQNTDPQTQSGPSKFEHTLPQTQSQTIESQDNNPDSQDNGVFTSLTTPTRANEIQNIHPQTQLGAIEPAIGQDLKDNQPATTKRTSTSDEARSRWSCLKWFQTKQTPPLFEGADAGDQKENSSKSEGNQLEHRLELKGLLKIVCLNGNTTLLKIFLEKINDRLLLNENPLVVVTLQKMYKMQGSYKFKSLLSCVKILINNHNKVDLQGTDKKGDTALHLALSYGYEDLALLILEHGHGLTGVTNGQNLTPIEYGKPQFWNTYLDNCITIEKGGTLKFDVGFLQPLAKEELTDVKSSNASNESKWPRNPIKAVKAMYETCKSKCRFSTTGDGDMTALHLISQSKERKEFLMHPVFIAFITMKWKRLCRWHVLNLLLTTFTMGTFIAYTFLPCINAKIPWWLTIIGAGIIFIREIVQMVLLRRSYIMWENLVDIINVLFIGIVLACDCDRSGMWCGRVSFLSSFVFVSLSLQATFLLGALWNNLSITLYMFKKVSTSFLYSFFVFTPMMFAFVCSFHLVNNESLGISISNRTESNSSEENFNNFHSMWDATIKTLVMTTGEFEAASMKFDDLRWLLFVTFVFIAPIVILNLINGLAVSDIADIRKESEFISVCKKVRLLERYERAVVDNRSTIPSFLQWLFRDPWFPGSFFEKHESIICVKVNEMNKFAIKTKQQEKNTKKAENCVSNNKKDESRRQQESKIDRSTPNIDAITNETGEVSTAIDKNKNRSTPNIVAITNETGEVSTAIDKNTTFNEAIKHGSKHNGGIVSNGLQLIRCFLRLPSCCFKCYIDTRSFLLALYMSLDQSCVDKAKTIAKSQSKNKSRRGANELVDAEETEKPALVKKTAMNQSKTSTLSRSATGPSSPDSLDKQVQELQRQVQSVIAMLNDIRQQLPVS